MEDLDTVSFVVKMLLIHLPSMQRTPTVREIGAERLQPFVNSRDRLNNYCVARHVVIPEGSTAWVHQFISAIQAVMYAKTYFRISHGQLGALRRSLVGRRDERQQA